MRGRGGRGTGVCQTVCAVFPAGRQITWHSDMAGMRRAGEQLAAKWGRDSRQAVLVSRR